MTEAITTALGRDKLRKIVYTATAVRKPNVLKDTSSISTKNEEILDNEPLGLL